MAARTDGSAEVAMDQTPGPSGVVNQPVPGPSGSGSSGFVPAPLPPPLPPRTADQIRTDHLDPYLRSGDEGARGFAGATMASFHGVAEELVKYYGELKEVKRTVNEALRADHKHMLRCWGTYLPADLRGQDLKATFINAVKAKHGIDVDVSDIGNIYIGPKNSIIVTLLHIGQGSAHDKLMYRHGNPNGWSGADGVDVCLEHFLTGQDRQLRDELLLLRKKDKQRFGNNTDEQRSNWRVYSVGMSRAGGLGYSRFLADCQSEMMEINAPEDVMRLMTPEERVDYEQRLAKRATDKANGEEKRRNERACKPARRNKQKRGPLGGNPGRGGRGGGRGGGRNANLVALGHRPEGPPLQNMAANQPTQQAPPMPVVSQPGTVPYAAAVTNSPPSEAGLAYNNDQARQQNNVRLFNVQNGSGKKDKRRH